MSGRAESTAKESLMKNPLNWIAALVFATIIPMAATGCQEGPAENAGKQIDQAGRDLKDAVDPAGPAEKAGRAVDDALNP